VLCYPHKAEAAVNTDKARPKKQPKPLRHKEPDRFSKAVAPDVASEIQALAHEIMGMQDNDPDRPARIRKLMRLMADHGVPVRPEDMACLQPMNASSPKLVDVPLRWHPYHIKKEAIERSHLCDDAPDGDAKESCREEKYGQAVMWAEPELAGQCRGMGDIDAVAECAKRKFLNAWAKNDGIVSAPVPQNRNISPECNASVPPVRRADNLRDRLRALLAQEGGKENGQIAQPLGGAPMAANPTTIAPPAPTPVDDDEAYCNYMAREVVRGELTPDPRTAIPPGCRATVAAALALKAKQQADGDRPFTMNADDTDREIAKLLGPAEKK
jgi:hypothetical protein